VTLPVIARANHSRDERCRRVWRGHYGTEQDHPGRLPHLAPNDELANILVEADQ
jgi:hypothetical protein